MIWAAIVILAVVAWNQHTQIKQLKDKIALLEKWRDMKINSAGPWT